MKINLDFDDNNIIITFEETQSTVEDNNFYLKHKFEYNEFHLNKIKSRNHASGTSG